MIHPKTELKFISDQVGYGVFATEDIPEGTIVYVKDSLELVITPSDFRSQTSEMKEVIEKYSYIDENGNRIISWDFAKYVNHCCNCNTMSTGYGFEIAIRDIKKGEEITDEYGLFNLQEEMDLLCGEACCRKKVAPSDFDTYYKQWDQIIKKSILKLFEVDQPLVPYVDEDTRLQLELLHHNPKHYKSVYALKFQPEKHLNGTKKIIV
ncbi:MAG: SET domain-containing protein [Cyclobacteriaceae bacterium]|nr:SET domain-containing protein [Cyclobacteriaceae bacterium]